MRKCARALRRNGECGLLGPAEVALGLPDLLGAEGIAVRVPRAREVRCAIGHHRHDHDERRLVPRRPGGLHRALERWHIVAVGHLLDVPALSAKASADVLREGERRRARQGHAVRVVKNDQLAELEVTGQEMPLRPARPPMRSPSPASAYV